MRRAPTQFDALGDPSPWERRVIDDLLLEGLVRSEGAAAPFVQPALAQTCVLDPIGAPRSATCRLRTDVTFHNGAELAAADALYSFSLWLDPRRSALRQRHGLQHLREVTLLEPERAAQMLGKQDAWGNPVDARPGAWVRIAFSRAEPLMLEAVSAMKIVPEAAHRGHVQSFARHPIGTGPMKLVAAEAERVVLRRIAKDTRPSDPRPRTIVLRGMPDGAAALTALRRGEVQILAEVSHTHIPVELAKPGMAARFSAWLLTPPRFSLLLYNLRRSNLGPTAVRRALDQALPSVAVAMPAWPAKAPVDLAPPQPVDLVALGAAGVEAAWGAAGLPATPARDDDAALRAAASELDAAGWPLERGVRRRASGPLRLVLLWDGARPAARMASSIREAWQHLGVPLAYATASWGYSYGLMERGEFDVAMAELAGTHDLFAYFHSRGEFNLTGVSDASLDAALVAYREATDAPGRASADAMIAARLAELVPVSVLAQPTELMLVSAQVGSVVFADDLPRLDRLTFTGQPAWDLAR